MLWENMLLHCANKVTFYQRMESMNDWRELAIEMLEEWWSQVKRDRNREGGAWGDFAGFWIWKKWRVGSSDCPTTVLWIYWVLISISDSKIFINTRTININVLDINSECTEQSPPLEMASWLHLKTTCSILSVVLISIWNSALVVSTLKKMWRIWMLFEM